MKSYLLRGVISLERDNLDCIHLKYGLLRGVASLEVDNLVCIKKQQLNCPPKERPTFLKGHFFLADRMAL
jgi:hypothetical protein